VELGARAKIKGELDKRNFTVPALRVDSMEAHKGMFFEIIPFVDSMERIAVALFAIPANWTCAEVLYLALL